MNEFMMVVAFIAAVLTIGWAVALLVAVWKVRDALVDAEFPTVDMDAGGTSYRIQVNRVRGRYGATYQRKDGQPVTVEPKFKSAGDVAVHIRKTVTAG